MSRARDLSKLSSPSNFTVDTNNNIGVNSTSPDAKFDVVGIVSATKYFGDGSELTGITAGATLSAGSGDQKVVLTSKTAGQVMTTAGIDAELTYNSTSNTLSATTFSGNITGVAATFTGNVSVGGTLTYEDVTNIDSVGIITARSDVSIADKIIHTGDTNTAIRFPAADTFTVETAGSEAHRVDSSQRLLVGRIASVLDNIGGTGYANLVQIEGAATGSGLAVSNTGGTARVNISRKYTPSNGDDLGYLSFGAEVGSTVERARITCSAEFTNANARGGQLKFSTCADGNHDPSERLRITAAGRFGFNTTSPDYTVDINGELGITEGQPVTWHDGSGNAAAQIYGDSSSNLIFRTGVSGMGERMRLLPAGGLTFNGDTAAANALDDYEEGTWTPSIGGNASYTTQTGTYTKVGRLVYVNCNIQINVIGTGSVTTITGLPFSASGGLADSSAVGYWSSGSRNVTTLMACTNATQIVFTDTASAVSGTTLNGGIFQNSTNVRFGLCYQV